MDASHVRKEKQGCPKKKGGQPSPTGKCNLSRDTRDGCELCEKGKVGMSEKEKGGQPSPTGKRNLSQGYTSWVRGMGERKSRDVRRRKVGSQARRGKRQLISLPATGGGIGGNKITEVEREQAYIYLLLITLYCSAVVQRNWANRHICYEKIVLLRKVHLTKKVSKVAQSINKRDIFVRS